MRPGKILKSYRLQSPAHPTRYDIDLVPDIESSTFEAHVDITLEIEERLTCLELNSKCLEFDDIIIARADGTSLGGTIFNDPETEISTIQFNGILGKGTWTLSIAYRGKINTHLSGLYKSSFIDENGISHTIVATHFEPTHARSVFPCFDEPSFKAVFSVKVLTEEHLRVISNAPQIDNARSNEALNIALFKKHLESKDHTDLKMVVFEDTVPISTYLVALIIGELNRSAPIMHDLVEIRLWSRLTEPKLFEFALSAASYALDFYEKYFGIKYPGTKIDLVAVPDFPIGAMENMGCITFREDALLVDPDDTTLSSLVRVAEIVMHEIAHMWFGNLTTMSWWNGLWLKESFATFMANLCLDSWRPDWNVWTSFAAIRLAAMSLDSLKSTHPIECAVIHPDEATEMFDMISYNKGCSILYQLFELVGATTFQNGCAKYLAAHQWQCTNTEDFWQSMQNACLDAGDSHPIVQLMNDWVYQTGHPVIVIEDTDSAQFYKISQKKFSITKFEEQEKNTWCVPLFLKTLKDGVATNKYITFSKDTEVIYLPEDIDLAIFNSDGAGFYRVIYSKSLYTTLLENLGSSVSNIERFNLLNDFWLSTLSGATSIEDFFEMLQSYREETEPQIWIFIQSILTHTNRLITTDLARFAFRNFIKHLTATNIARLSWNSSPDDTQVDRELRAIIFSIHGTLVKDKETIDRAKASYKAILEGSLHFDQEFKSEIVKLVAAQGDAELYEQFLELAESAKTPQESSRFTYALAFFQEDELVKRTLDLCLDGTIRSQDAPHIVAKLLTSDRHSNRAWQFIKDNFTFIINSFPQISSRKMCSQLNCLDTEEFYTDVDSFFAINHLPGGEKAILQMLENLGANLAFRERNQTRIDAYFNNYH